MTGGCHGYEDDIHCELLEDDVSESSWPSVEVLYDDSSYSSIDVSVDSDSSFSVSIKHDCEIIPYFCFCNAHSS